jgi:hypothetical protein
VIGVLQVEKVDVLEGWLPADLRSPQCGRQLFEMMRVYHEEALVYRKLLYHFLVPLEVVVPVLHRSVLLMILVVLQIPQPLGELLPDLRVVHDTDHVLGPLALEQPVVVKVAWQLHGALLETVGGPTAAAGAGGTRVLWVQQGRLLDCEEDAGVVQGRDNRVLWRRCLI